MINPRTSKFTNMKKILIRSITLALALNSHAQITTSEVKVEQTGNLTTISGQTNIAGITTSNGIKIPGAFTLEPEHSQSAIEIAVSSGSYNAIRGYNGKQLLGTIHFFDDTWSSSSPSSSAGSINLDGVTAVTIGSWNDPITYFRQSDGFVGIGTETPNDRLDVNGITSTKGLRIPGAYTFEQGHSQSAIEIAVSSGSYNAIRGYNGKQLLGTIHFFDDTWSSSSPSSSAGSINLDGVTAVTIGSWNSPAAYFRESDGFVGIGIENPTERLHVNGNIRATAPIWSDFVFYDNYELPTLEEVEEHIAEKGHLPEIPTKAEVSENGINLGEMDAKLLQKIEELTLYMIDMNKRMGQLEQENRELREEILTLKNK